MIGGTYDVELVVVDWRGKRDTIEMTIAACGRANAHDIARRAIDRRPGGWRVEKIRSKIVVGTCEQRCGADATVYAMGRGAGDWGGRYCESCADALGFVVTDRLEAAHA